MRWPSFRFLIAPASLMLAAAGDPPASVRGDYVLAMRAAGGYLDESQPLPDRTAFLTFDDGPGPFTDAILDTLRDEKVPASFFVNAGNGRPKDGLALYAPTLRRIRDEGHLLGNHTVDHVNLTSRNDLDVARQIDENVRLIGEAVGDPKLEMLAMRPPFGYVNKRVQRTLSTRGLTFLWNLNSEDSNDWVAGERPDGNGNPQSAAYRAKVARTTRVVGNSPLVVEGKGVIVLMHDIHPTARDALPAIIAALRARGYAFASLAAFLPASRPDPAAADGWVSLLDGRDLSKAQDPQADDFELEVRYPGGAATVALVSREGTVEFPFVDHGDGSEAHLLKRGRFIEVWVEGQLASRTELPSGRRRQVVMRSSEAPPQTLRIRRLEP